MGGSKCDKQKNAGDSDPPGALFPRLHVKETRNNGPRAPPRNKMALYEQFTVPSHRFQQSQQQHSPAVMPQQPFIPQTFTGPYYLPYYMTSSMGYQPMSMVNQPNNNELQEAREGHVGESTGRVSKGPCLESTLENAAGQNKGEFSVPAYSSKTKTREKHSSKVSLGHSTLSSVVNSRGAVACTKVPAVHPGGRSTSRRKSSAERHRRSESGKNVQEPVISQAPRYESLSNIEANEETGGVDNQSDEDPGRPYSQEEAEDSEESEISVLENIALPSVNSKDIMTAVGDVTFWKMRKALQRQQGIFHKQLFELHRVTKVQQLMASAGLCDKEGEGEGEGEGEDEDEQPNNVETTWEEDGKKSPEAEAGQQQKQVIDVEDDSPPNQPPPEAATAETRSNDHVFYPPPPANNMGYYSGFPGGGNQWFTPMNHWYQQPTPAVGILATPYGPVYGGPFPPAPFVQYSCEQRPPDSRYDMLQRVPSWQQPPHYFTMQWPGYPNPGPLQPPAESSRENAAVSSSHSRRNNSERLQSQAGSSSAGVGLVRSSGAKKAVEHQQQYPQQQQQVKLVGKYTEASQSQSQSMSAGNQRHGASPYSRPSGFQAFGSETNGERGNQVTPKASLVTPESAAEILQSIRQDRIER